MSLIWKLLRQHISIPQFIGFFFANLFGMFIVLLGIQFYRDVVPVFTAEDSFMKSDYLIISKKIGAGTTISGRSSSFSKYNIAEVTHQDFIKKVGAFTGNDFKVTAQMGVDGNNILNSEIFLQSIPDEFIDVPKTDWIFTEGSKEVPIILPRTYISMYNFGFAQSRSLPKISEGLMGMIDFNLNIRGNGKQDDFKGRVIGFSSRMSEIMVPDSFMKWANNYYAPDGEAAPNRLIVEVTNPADERIGKFLENREYEMDDEKLDAEKTTYFLRMVVTLVMLIGLVISILSFYILMLSIYLLVQKNSSKLQNLLLIGYRPSRVALPYQTLTVILNLSVLVIAWVTLYMVRDYYMDIIYSLYPQMQDGSMMPAIIFGIILFALVTIVNYIAIQRKVMVLWRSR